MESFAREFLDDYFAECEEHLAELRNALLRLDESPKRRWTEAELKAVQRSLHTLKGLSGMVAFEELERTAHTLEELVRRMVEGGGALDATIEPLLFKGVGVLERALHERRAGAPPEVDQGFVADVASVLEEKPPESRAAAGEPTTRTWEIRFVPSSERLARGVGVEVVRKRLAKVGAIQSVTPRIPPGEGGVVFHFALDAPPDWQPDPAWRDDGLDWDEPRSSEQAPAAPAAFASPAAPAAAPFAGNVVRVDLARLDDLMRAVGELVVSRARLEAALDHLGGDDAQGHVASAKETSELMERQLRTLREGVMRVRLVPIGEVFERLRFAIRDLARDQGKEVTVDVVGADTEIDRLVVDRMMEPLLHLVRNAVSHGIEGPDVRTRAGKPARGRIALRAAAEGDRIRIEVEDDGAGVDTAAVLRRAASHGIEVGDQAVDDQHILDLLCSPGLSTREQVDRASGRGVGMDVVRATVRALNGDLSMRSQPGRGTLFLVDLPLTLMIVDALLVRVGDQTMAVPQPVLREILKIDANTVTPMGEGEIIPYRGGVLPLLRLSRFFRMENGADRPSMHVLVVGDDGDRVGLAVEGVSGLREIVVLPVDDPIVATSGVSGATELSDGRLGLILDAAALTREMRGRAAAKRALGAMVEA